MSLDNKDKKIAYLQEKLKKVENKRQAMVTKNYQLKAKLAEKSLKLEDLKNRFA